jgi:hypothetical protein
LTSPDGFIAQDIKKYQKQTFLQIFFSFDVVLCQKVVHIKFFEDLYFVRFVTKLILKSQRNLPENINKEAI